MIRINDTLIQDPYFIDYQMGFIRSEFEYNGVKMQIDLCSMNYVMFHIFNEDGFTEYLQTNTLDYFCGGCKSFEAKGTFIISDYTIEIDGVFVANETAVMPIDPIEPEPEPINQTQNN